MSLHNKETRIRLPEVLAILPVSKSSFYRGIREGLYPAGKPLGKRAVGWNLHEIEKIARQGVDVEGGEQ